MRLHGERAFGGILAGQLVSSVGSAMTRFGLVIWTLAETGDTTAYSLLLLASFLPLGLGALVAGPLVDRWDRRRVMIVANAVASLSTLAIALLYVTESLATWHLYVALFVNGIANAFVLPAFDASVPLLVRKEQLGRAAGLSQMIAGLEMILGPALAGIVLGAFGLGIPARTAAVDVALGAHHHGDAAHAWVRVRPLHAPRAELCRRAGGGNGAGELWLRRTRIRRAAGSVGRAS